MVACGQSVTLPLKPHYYIGWNVQIGLVLYYPTMNVRCMMAKRGPLESFVMWRKITGDHEYASNSDDTESYISLSQVPLISK